MDKREGVDAWAATLAVHATLTNGRSVSPFVEGGFGLYLASFDPRRAADIPSFYADRISGSGINTFTDPAFFAGAGIDLLRNRHWAIRPAAGFLTAFHRSDTYITRLFSVQIEHHFEKHPSPPQ
jgi:hypothetical protein